MTGLEVDANGNGSLKKLKPSETIGKNIQCRELFVVELEQVVIYPLQKMEVWIKILSYRSNIMKLSALFLGFLAMELSGKKASLITYD
ncbi:hypothetical protein HN873_012847, partial [Arachis hypogaea]